jgi:hypothetical protein
MHELSLQEEEAIIQRALRFAYAHLDLRSVRRVCQECRIVWPRSEYTLRSEVWLRGWLLRLRRSTKLTQPDKDIAMRELVRVRRDFQKSVNYVVEQRDSEDLALAVESLDRVCVIAELTEANNGALPAEVLAAYAMTLMTDRALPWHKRVRRCKVCRQTFLAKSTGGRLPDSHEDCRKKAKAMYMSDYRDPRTERKIRRRPAKIS